MVETQDMSTAEVRRNLADVIHAAIRGETTYITSRGRRVAAVVPTPVADRAEQHPG